jgi:hypothetical protein
LRRGQAAAPALVSSAHGVGFSFLNVKPHAATIRPDLKESVVERILVIAYRPEPGQRDATVRILEAQHARAREIGVLRSSRPILGEGTHGEIVVIVELVAGTDLDVLWEDELFQDLDARLATLAVMVPVRALDESSAMYMDIAALQRRE